MTNAGSNGNRPSKNQRRVAAREKAKALREAQKKRERRNRIFLQGGIGLAVLVALAIVAVIIIGSIRPPAQGPANMASDGIVLGKGLKVIPTKALDPSATPIPSTPNPKDSVVDIRTYVDYLCPYCGEFEKTNAKQIGELVKSGAATVEIHPIALLTSHSQGTKYSLRAANAAACVANYSPNNFYAYQEELFGNQPKEGSTGLPNSTLKGFLGKAGISSANVKKIEKCIDDGTYESWVQDATDRAISKPIPNSNVKTFPGTPLVLVNGKQYKGSLTDPKEFRSFVVQASGATYSTSKPTAPATPTPTSTPAG